MDNVIATNQRAIIMGLLKDKFQGFVFWDRIESTLAVSCSKIPDIIGNNKQKGALIGILKDIKSFLVGEGVIPDELNFLDDEIERYEYTKQISLYEEKEGFVEPEIIEKYSRLGYGTEGVVGIHLPYNYEQLSKLTNEVYKKTNLIKFYISREKTLYGQIIAEIFEYPQKIPVATLIKSKKLDKETDEPVKKWIALFGQKYSKNEYHVVKEIEVPFRVYRFISENNQDFILLSSEEILIGDYIITGVTTQMDDYRALTDSSKLPTKLPYFFAQSIKNRISKYQNHGEFKASIGRLNITKKNLFEYPFAIYSKKYNKKFIMKHPTWFKWLIWAWLLHSNEGVINEYPLHICIIGPQQSGKSVLLGGLHINSKETRSIFSGSSSTLKRLVPSFKYQPARLGYLAESNRFSFCDEFLRCLMNTRTLSKGGEREEGVAIMNDLLEHQKREAGSGVSSVHVNMTSRVLAATNPIKGIHCVEDLLNALDKSFCSRWLIYYQTDSHIKVVRECKDSDLNTYDFKLDSLDWISIIDYLQTVKITYEEDIVEEILQSVVPLLSSTLKDHYDSRHRHHIGRIMDGIVKARCLFEHDMSFNPTKQDYDMLKTIWLGIIKSWIKGDIIKTLPLSGRADYLPENSQYIYKIICDAKKILRVDLVELATKDMTKPQFNEFYLILWDNRLVKEEERYVKPYYEK